MEWDRLAQEAEALFEACLAAVPEGGAPDVEPLCRARPDLADALRELAADYARGTETVAAFVGCSTEWTADRSGERYTVRREIARGGMGCVLEVWDDELRRTLAMKVLRDPPEPVGLDRIAFERRRSRLVNEAQVLGQLEHPGIVPIHEVGSDAQGRPYFTMLRVRGRELSEVFADVQARRTEWSVTRVVGILTRVCEAISHAHARGVIHRDLKPANVMVGTYGEVFVMDWGLAKARGRPEAADIRLRTAPFSAAAAPTVEAGEEPPSVRTDRRDASESDLVSPLLTMDGDVVGTPAYMAPEQARGRVEAVDERSDVYSVGAMLYHLLAGRPPYARGADADSTDAAAHGQEGHMELLARVAEEPPVPLRELAPSAPPELVAVAEKAMARVPSRRYARMTDLAEDLRAHLEGRVVKAHDSGTLAALGKWVRRHRALVWMLTALFVTLTASAIGLALLYLDAERGRLSADRRLGLLRERVGGPQLNLDGIPSLMSFHDDFEDGVLSPRLRIWSHPERVRERDGALVLEQRGPSGSETFLGLDPSSQVIRGDFDLSVSFETEGYSVPHRGWRWFGINVRTAVERRLVAMLHRFSGWEEEESGPVVECYELKTNEGGFQIHVPTAGQGGKMRIARKGARISVHVGEGDGWRELASDEGTLGPVTFGMYCTGTHGDDGAYRVRFDDLRLETSARAELTPVEAFVETFAEGLPRYFRTSEVGDGVAGVVEGRLLLERLPGRTGWMSLELDWPRCVLRGDFDVSLRYGLEDFRPVRAGDTLCFALSIYSVQDRTEALARISRYCVPDEDPAEFLSAFTSAWDVQPRSRPYSGDEGRLRVRRRGSLYSMEYWDEGWELLLEREGSTADAYFKIYLDSPRQGALATIDDLRMEGLHTSY